MTKSSPRTDAHVVTPRRRHESPSRHYEWRVVEIASNVTYSEARGILTEQAEYGQWELARSVLYEGGSRKVWLRRRVIKLQRTDAL